MDDLDAMIAEWEKGDPNFRSLLEGAIYKRGYESGAREAEGDPRRALTADKLEAIAGWLDMTDKMLDRYVQALRKVKENETADAIEAERGDDRSEIQDELRSIAAALSAGRDEER